MALYSTDLANPLSRTEKQTALTETVETFNIYVIPLRNAYTVSNIGVKRTLLDEISFDSHLRSLRLESSIRINIRGPKRRCLLDVSV